MRPLIGFLVLAIAGVAHADPAHWYSGADGKRRNHHLVVSAIGGALYLSSETLFKSKLAAVECRWCDPPGFDSSVRDALRWNHVDRAKTISNLLAFVIEPAVGLGLFVVTSKGGESRFSRWIDDALPLVESAILASLINQATKFSVGRQRPFVHFGDPALAHETDDNVSFFSGHTTLAFSIATSAGVIAHQRQYSLEPVIWTTGYLLAATTGYLRIAGDQHYISDVVVGAVVGTTVGVLVPLVFHPGRDVQLVPTGKGVALLGSF